MTTRSNTMRPRRRAPLTSVLGLAAAGLAALVALALGASSAGADVLYVPNQGSDSLLVLDPSTGATVGSVPVASPFSVVVTPDGSRAYVSGSVDGVFVVDTVANAVVATIPVPALALAMSPDGTRVYAAGPTGFSSGEVWVIDTSTNALVGGSAAIPGFPLYATVSPDGTRLFVSDIVGFLSSDPSGTVSVFNAQTLELLGSIPLDDAPFGLAATSTTLYVALYFQTFVSEPTSSSEVLAFDIATYAPAGTTEVGAGPVAIALHPDGNRAYVTNFGDGTVSVVDLGSNTETGTIPVGEGPAGIVLSPGGARAYVTNYQSDSVSVIDIETGAVVDTFDVGERPVFLAYSTSKIATSTLVGSDVNPSASAQPVTFSATVTASSATPTGTVQFSVGGSALGDPVTLVDGTATSPSISRLAPGNHTVTADYSGSTAFSPSSGTFTQTVAPKLSQTITFTSMPPAGATFGGTYTVTATGGASGNPVVFSSATPATCTVSGSTVSFVGTGTCTINANQAGNANYEAAPQVQQTFTVAKATPSISTVASPGGLVGTPVRDVATVSGGFNPTGTVTFRLFSDAGCNTQVFTSTNPLGTPSDWFTPASAGTYRWIATYNGDANNTVVSGACNDPNESVTLAPFVAPAYTRIIQGDLMGPVTVTAGESVLIDVNARVVGPVTVQPGGALTVTTARIHKGIVADSPGFLSICGSEVAGPPPAQALGVSNAAVPVRIGDPATGCAANRFAGTVTLTANLAVTFGANSVSHATTVTNGGPGNTVIKANTFFATLACTGNTPAPTNAGQPNTAPSKTGQCAGI